MVIDERDGQSRQMALFPADCAPTPSEVDSLQVRLGELRLSRSRQWGACWQADRLWQTLSLDDFFGARPPLTREGPDWEKVLRIPVLLPADLAGFGMELAPPLVRDRRAARSVPDERA